MSSLISSHLFFPTIGLGLLLAACGGGSDGGSGTSTATIGGTAAIGAAIRGATITATCQDGSGFSGSPVTTDSNGKWSGKVESGQLPCLLELGDGTPNVDMISMAFAAGTANITPLTHLSLVLAKQDKDFKWTEDNDNWPAQTLVETSANTLMQSLKKKGYADASLSGSPFTTGFDANGAGWDKVLDKLRELVEDPAGSINGYEELAQLLADGNIASLPEYKASTDPTDPTVAQSAVDPADFGTNVAPTKEEFLTVMKSESWTVAIYETPEEHPEWYGEGSLTIGGTTSNWTMELKGADGSVIASLDADGALTKDFRAFSQYLDGHIFINKGTAVSDYLNAYANQSTGLLNGSAGGDGEVKFRNSVVAYGAGVPAIFAELNGTWTGTYENYCVSPPAVDSNTITITEDGEVTLENAGSQDCNDVFPQSFSWGDKDDFLIPDPEETDGSFIMHIDSTDFWNVSKGMLKIKFDADMNVTKFTAKTPSAYEMEDPVKQ